MNFQNNTISGFFNLVKDEFRKHPGVEIILPKRSTSMSAGYDFCTPESFTLCPGEQKLVWTDIKFFTLDGTFCLKIYPRSSVGTKMNCILANTVGIIDADYCGNPDNDGNIGICLRNIGDQTVSFNEGDRIAQGIIERYYVISSDAPVTELRSAGFGSTGK